MGKFQTNGTTLTFGSSSFIADIIDYSKDGETADDVETSDLSTTGNRTYDPGALVEGGTYTFQLHVDKVKQKLTTGVKDTATTTFPLSVPTNTVNASDVFSTYVNSWSETGALNELVNATMVLKVDGNITSTPES